MTALSRSWLPTILFGLAGLMFVVGPSIVDGGIPGDLGDARLNSYILEHFYRWITRQDASFLSADFFYPFPLAIAFSDNLLGDAFIHAWFRALGFSREDAFRLWYVAGFAINFAAANYALVRLGYSKLASPFGAFLFAFGLPVTAQESHAQLIYRFAVPLAVLALEDLGSRKQLRQLALVAFWTTWQFYCSIYIGYFLTLLLLALVLGHALCFRGDPTSGIRSLSLQAGRLWTASTAPGRAAFLLTMMVLAAMMVLLFVPYLEVTVLYGFHRQWPEIAMMLPRPASYLFAKDSSFWPSTGLLLETLPLPVLGEHAMFIGTIPLLTIVGAVPLRLANRVPRDRLFAPAALAILLLMLLTLWVDGYSAYRVVTWLPGVNAIRAVTRIITVLLFPFGILLASSLDTMRTAPLPCWARVVMGALIGALLVFEASYISHYQSSTSKWGARMTTVEAELPVAIPRAPILLLSPKPDEPEPWARDLDAMLFAQDHGWRTLNGYSGNSPPRHQNVGQCQDAALALVTSLAFLHRNTEQDYDALARHLVMVGYSHCDGVALPRNPP